ncbi:MAG: phosphatase PAP2 family protein [Prevotella sp.]|jgi:membrane-associated phospholipid phosphatase
MTKDFRKCFAVCLVAILLHSGLPASAHDLNNDGDTCCLQTDTVLEDSAREHFLDRIAASRVFKATYIGVPLIVGGLIEKHQDDKFRQLRNDFMPYFHRTLDNYTQFLPAAVLVGMKMAGVPSASTWKRMLVADAISTAIMSSTVWTLKNITHVERPDGSNCQSFPSGHTATAFMTATMLNEEYGHLSPWVGVGAYTAATATGLMRMANNKHWLSDVMVGAGIGIISTEMGYWLADVILHGKGKNQVSHYDDRLTDKTPPSFLSLNVGFNLPLSHYDIDESHTFSTSTGTTMGFEGAWFFHQNFGIGGRLSISNLQYIVNENDAPNNTFDFYGFGAGLYVNFPLSMRWSIGGNAMPIFTHYTRTQIGDTSIPANSGWGLGTGASLNYRVHRHLGASVFLDYNLQSPCGNTREYMHIMTLGARVAYLF